MFRPHLKLPDAKQFEVEKVEDGYRINGKRIEQIAIMTDMTKKGGIYRVHDILKKIGAQKELQRLGAEEGDSVFIGPHTFSFMILS